MGSRDEVTVGKERVRARQYPWGTVLGKQVINYSVSYLRNMNSVGSVIPYNDCVINAHNVNFNPPCDIYPHVNARPRW